MPRAPLPPELQRFIDKPRHAVVGTVRADSTPVTTPRWYGVDAWGASSSRWATTATGTATSRRTRAWRSRLGTTGDPRVSIVGRAVELRPDPDLADIDALSQHLRGRCVRRPRVPRRDRVHRDRALARGATRPARPDGPRLPLAAAPEPERAAGAGAENADPLAVRPSARRSGSGRTAARGRREVAVRPARMHSWEPQRLGTRSRTPRFRPRRSARV